MFGSGRPTAPYFSSIVGTFYTRTGTFFRVNKFETMEICTGTADYGYTIFLITRFTDGTLVYILSNSQSGEGNLKFVQMLNSNENLRDIFYDIIIKLTRTILQINIRFRHDDL